MVGHRVPAAPDAVPLDLTGPSGGWNAATRSLWEECLSSAVRGPGAWETPPRTGIMELRTALADHLGLDPAEVAVTSGIRAEVAELLRGAGTLLVENPTFLSIPRLARELGVTVSPLSWEDILRGDRVTRDSVVWVTSPARNPDGRTLTAAEADRLDELAGQCRRVVVNQAYHWCAPRAPRPRRAVLVGSLHKIAGGGCALGWRSVPGGPGPGRPAHGGPPTAWQLAWTSFLAAGGAARLAETGLLAAQRRCGTAAQRLLRLPDGALRYAGAGPSLLVTLPGLAGDGQAGELPEVFAAHGLAVGAGPVFGCGPDTVRLCFTGLADRDLDRCVQRVHAVVRAPGPTPSHDRAEARPTRRNSLDPRARHER